VYVDANPFVYAIEGEEAIAKPIKEFFDCLRNRPALAVTSELTLAEVLPKAPKPDARRSYFDLIVWSGIFLLQPVSREILVETADYRRVAAVKFPDGRTSMPKLPDAIHVVTAIRSGCTRILSADTKLKLPHGMEAIRPSQEGISVLLQAIQ